MLHCIDEISCSYESNRVFITIIFLQRTTSNRIESVCLRMWNPLQVYQSQFVSAYFPNTTTNLYGIEYVAQFNFLRRNFVQISENIPDRRC